MGCKRRFVSGFLKVFFLSDCGERLFFPVFACLLVEKEFGWIRLNHYDFEIFISSSVSICLCFVMVLLC